MMIFLRVNVTVITLSTRHYNKNAPYPYSAKFVFVGVRGSEDHQ